MSEQIQKQMAESLSKIEAVFAPGFAGDKRDEMRALRETGDTRFFEGGVRWSVLLDDADKRLKGESESLDTAFGDMASCLDLLARDHGDDAAVICTIELAA